MANAILLTNGTPVVWADTTDYSSTGSGYSRTHQITLASLANGKAREGAKADLGEDRSPAYSVYLGWESGSAPSAAQEVDIYWASSFSGTAGTGNDAGAAGADGAYKDGEEAEWLRQALFVGSLITTADAAGTVQRQCVNNYFRPPNRYGMPIVYNRSGQTADSDDIQMYVALVGQNPEIQ